jgi:hypothetical protein
LRGEMNEEHAIGRIGMARMQAAPRGGSPPTSDRMHMHTARWWGALLGVLGCGGRCVPESPSSACTAALAKNPPSHSARSAPYHAEPEDLEDLVTCGRREQRASTKRAR